MKHVARKRFGQNFLIDNAVIDAIIAAIGADASDTMVEIGPGLGALTLPLARALRDAGGGALHVVELDRDLIGRLERHVSRQPLVVHEGDALKFDFRGLVCGQQQLRMVGNLPYNISSPLLFRLIEIKDAVRDQHFMLQKEVVERMTARAGQAAFGRLSVMLQIHYRMELLFDVRPDAFEPAPRVTSSIVRMIPDDTLANQIIDRGGFAMLVGEAFQQRRKMLRNTLAAYHRVIELERSGISATARAEDVTAAQYVDYANRFSAFGADPVAR